MNDSWTCLNVEKGPGMISNMVRNVLKAAACDLHVKKWDTMHIENDMVSGIITTNWDTHVVGGRSGVLFRAQIDCEDGPNYKVNFLFHEKDLERGAEIIREMEEREGGEVWGTTSARIPCEELYRFYDLRGPGRTVH